MGKTEAPCTSPTTSAERLRAAGRRLVRVLAPLVVALAPGGLFASDPAVLSPNIFAPESAPAHSIDSLARFVLETTAGIFVVVMGLIIYAVVRFRHRPDDDGKEPPQVYGSNPVEAAWTTIPFLIVVVLALTTTRIIHAVQDAPKPPGALNVQAIGHQWWWEIRYPDLGLVTANELHVPVSTAEKRVPTFIDLRSADVAHSFWVPRLAGKTDLIPNKINSMWIEPERTGVYLGQCSQYCGVQHAYMLLRVYVQTPEEFERWVKDQQALAASSPEVAAGRRVFEQTACVNCHALNGTGAAGRFGPDLTHLMSRDTLGSGVLKNTPANLRAWIENPDKFKPGVLMPAMNLSHAELDQVVAYLLTLR
jgi:cytochrome c oxidase subunit 2